MKSIGNRIFALQFSPPDNSVWTGMTKVCDNVWDNISVIIRQSIVESVRDIAYEAD